MEVLSQVDLIEHDKGASIPLAFRIRYGVSVICISFSEINIAVIGLPLGSVYSSSSVAAYFILLYSLG